MGSPQPRKRVWSQKSKARPNADPVPAQDGSAQPVIPAGAGIAHPGPESMPTQPTHLQTAATAGMDSIFNRKRNGKQLVSNDPIRFDPSPPSPSPQFPPEIEISALAKKRAEVYHRDDFAVFLSNTREAYIRGLGKLPGLKEALALSDAPKIQAFLAALSNPDYSHLSFNTIASHFGVHPKELAQLWKSHNMDKGMVLASGIFPPLIKDLAEDVKSTKVCCPRCDGRGEIESTGSQPENSVPVTAPCPQCAGKKLVRKPGDPKSREFVLKTLGVIDKPAPAVSSTVYNTKVETFIEELELSDARPAPGPLPAIDVTPENSVE